MAPTLPFDIIFEDPHLLVIHKPAGLLSQGGESSGPNLVEELRKYLGRPYVGLVHRLDRNTSGLMVVAKRTKAANRLSEALREGSIERHYLAILEGRLLGPQKWRDWLLKDEATNVVKIINEQVAGAKEAILAVSPQKYGRWRGLDLTLAEFTLETGRSHQIRAQAASHGFPLLGDMKYANSTRVGASFGRPALHSYYLKFPHPKEGEGFKEFEISLPEDMGQVEFE